MKVGDSMKENNDTQGLYVRIKMISDLKFGSVNKMLKECGLSKSTVSNIKSGSMPSSDKLNAIADTLGTTSDWLLTGENPDGTGGMMMSIDKEAFISAVSKVKNDAVQNVVDSMFIDSEQYKKQKAFEKLLAEPVDTNIIEVPDELSNLPVPAIIAIGSDENASAKIKEICEKYNNLSDENKSLAEHLLDELENNPDSGELISGILQLMKKQKPSTNGR